jgi:hypothetical protein
METFIIWARWCTPIIPGLRRLKQEDVTFEASLRYIERLCLRKKERRKEGRKEGREEGREEGGRKEGKAKELFIIHLLVITHFFIHTFIYPFFPHFLHLSTNSLSTLHVSIPPASGNYLAN